MGTRAYNFINGFETPTQPTATNPASDSDVVSKGYGDSTYQPKQVVTGSLASPTLITAAGGITPVGALVEYIFVAGSGGAVDISANPQIAAGTQIGQRLIIIGCSDTDTVGLDDGDGLFLQGQAVLKKYNVLKLIWVDTGWMDDGRNF